MVVNLLVFSLDSLSHYSLYAGNVYCKPHQRKVEWEDLQAGVKTPVKKGESHYFTIFIFDKEYPGYLSLTLILQRVKDSCNPPVIFSNNFFWATEGCQMTMLNLCYPYNASFRICKEIFGCGMGRGVVKNIGRWEGGCW